MSATVSRNAQPALRAELAAGLATLYQVSGNLQTVRAAGRVIVPVIAQALKLMPGNSVRTAGGRVYRVPNRGPGTDVCVHAASGLSGVPLGRRGGGKQWGMFADDLGEIVDTLLANPVVRALSDPKLERLAHVLEI